MMIGRQPFDVVHIDHLGPFPTTGRKNKYVLGLIDNLTKYAVLMAVKNVSARETVKMCERYISQFTAPKRFVTDRGTCFTSQDFQKLCTDYEIKHTLNSSRHPKANGLIERLNQTVLPIMQMAVDSPEQNNWDLKLIKIQNDRSSIFVDSIIGYTFNHIERKRKRKRKNRIYPYIN